MITHSSEQQRKLLFSFLFVPLACTCCLLLIGSYDYLVNWDGTTDCRDSVIARVPIYPDSAFIAASRDIKSTSLTSDFIIQEYRSDATPQQIIDFYKSFAVCGNSRFVNSETECRGEVNQALWYTVKIPESGSAYTIEYQWLCGLD